MTRGGSARERRVEPDCHQTSPNVAGCSSKHSTQANDSSVLKIPNASPCRRQSLRLRAINTIYEAENATSSNIQQTVGDKSPSSNHIKVKNVRTPDPDDPTINMTLKDLQKRCKSKKRKSQKSIAFSATDLNHALVKPKEEEPDLVEPLICLKVKSTGRRKRKHSHISESILPVEEISYSSFSRRESSPVATDSDSSTIAKEVAARAESNSILESVNENLEVTSDEDPLHVGGQVIVSTVKSEIVETCNTVSSSSVFIDDCNALGDSTTKLSQIFSAEESADGESYFSTSKFLHPCVNCHTETARCFSSSTTTVSQMGASLEDVVSQSVNEDECEVIEIDPLARNGAAYVSASSDLNFIGKFNDPGSSSSELHERIGGAELEHEDTTPFTTEHVDCCTNEDSFQVKGTDSYTNLPESGKEPLDCVNEFVIRFMGADNYSTLPESSKEYCGEKKEIDFSESSCHKLLPSFSKAETLPLHADNSQFVSVATHLSSGVCGRAKNFNITLEKVLCDGVTKQMDSLARADSLQFKSENNSLEFRTSKEFENRGHEIPVLEAPICSRGNNVTAKHRSRDMYNFCHASGFSEEVGSLDSLVFKALCCDAHRNNNENNVISNMEKSSLVGTYDSCVPQHSSFSSCESHAATVNSPGTESLHCSTMDKMVNLPTRKTVSSVELSAEELINSHIEKSSREGISDPRNPCYSKISFSSVCDSHAANQNPPKTESSQYSTFDQMVNSCTEIAANSAEIGAEALDCHSPQDSPPGFGAVNDLLNVNDSSSEASKIIHSSAENTQYTPVEMPTCLSLETSNLIEGEGTNMENELKCDRGMKAEHPPKKLLSNRKELSPTSREKLRRALNGNESEDVMKTGNHEEVEMMLSSERMTKRSKTINNGSLQPHSKGILKPQDSSDRNCPCLKNSLFHTQAQKAVTFSRRQMQDIENIATKLLKGLASMKNIVMESVGSEACPSASSNFSPEEIRIAIEKASNLEANTKKWLSMMGKDCSRFCKIMKSTENKGASPVAVTKLPKKITFADEAGGLLCHVKVFEQLPASL